ncbi:MAG: motility protein A [Bdellovibrionales bacterium CG10_big_fil_rev_8_21_14_0_10_45_34]|nr:MAG: motility protein A [Bdellovibrionales bacterium CG10_big_fil_rev_8_21_14_0_10_45_34]
MDRASIFGVVLGVGAILFGQILEGGHVNSLIQLTAAIIVFGGTLGAVLVSAPPADLRMAGNLLPRAFKDSKEFDIDSLIEEISESAHIARKQSILALESRIPKFSNSYMQNIFRFVIDGVDPAHIRSVFETEIAMSEERRIAGAKVFSEAGGFAPTIGIIGAVLGLIHVMENLTDTAKLGSGIAIAFVATVYGIGSANLFFIPLGNKLKRKVQEESIAKEMILEGALGILAGINPHLLREKLESYKSQSRSKGRT